MQAPGRDRPKKKKYPFLKWWKDYTRRKGGFPEHFRKAFSVWVKTEASNWNSKFYMFCFFTIWIAEKSRVQPHSITTSHFDGLDFHCVGENVMWIPWLFQGNPAHLSSKGRWERMETLLRWSWSSKTTAAPPSDTTWSNTERWVASFPGFLQPHNPITRPVGPTVSLEQGGRAAHVPGRWLMGPCQGFKFQDWLRAFRSYPHWDPFIFFFNSLFF